VSYRFIVNHRTYSSILCFKLGIMASAPNTSLLGMSRELRDIIYLIAIPTPDAPPTSPSSYGLRKTLNWYEEEESWEHCVKYPVDRVSMSSTFLLLVNRQVHKEVGEPLARMKRLGSLKFKLDIMMEDEEHLHQTWMSVPAAISNFGILETTFRLFGSIKGRCPGRRPGDEAPCLIA
jgi:hypothetical protein